MVDKVLICLSYLRGCGMEKCRWNVVLFVFSVFVMTGCNSGDVSRDAQREKRDYEFCKMVKDVVTPDHPTCGKYINSIKNEGLVVLRDANKLSYVSISSKPEIWTDEFILYRVPNGTRARRLDVKEYAFAGGKTLRRIHVELVGNPTKGGWVFASDTQSIDSAQGQP